MRSSAWQEKKQQEHLKKAKSYQEFLVLAGVLLLAAGGFMALMPTKAAEIVKTPGSAFSQLVQQNGASGPISRPFPANYKTKGTVDDRYTVATDPKTGQMIIHDALGGIGTNSTSVDGDRARLANDMLDLDKYANLNRKKLSSDAYSWLRKVARTGMELAFGTPGLAPSAQPGIKKDILADFHDISANPTQSMMHSSYYLSLEPVFQRPEAAYLANGDTSGSNFLSVDPISPPLAISSSLIPSISSTLQVTWLSPTMSTLTAPTSPFDYTAPTLTATVLSPTVNSSPTLSTSSTTSISLTSTATSPITVSTSPTPTISDYYNDLFAPQVSSPSIP